ncbi:uncharacterized protein BO96DRAFT_333471, partial [Aspergillus niger CBS 101883]|uniref:uncharacterized protein n=1 Tax=Aspergillus lacticoffeatus (strain CBS 101883) TaxID=1450533 RepID=UPI000D7F8B08
IELDVPAANEGRYVGELLFFAVDYHIGFVKPSEALDLSRDRQGLVLLLVAVAVASLSTQLYCSTAACWCPKRQWRGDSQLPLTHSLTLTAAPLPSMRDTCQPRLAAISASSGDITTLALCEIWMDALLAVEYLSADNTSKNLSAAYLVSGDKIGGTPQSVIAN